MQSQHSVRIAKRNTGWHCWGDNHYIVRYNEETQEIRVACYQGAWDFLPTLNHIKEDPGQHYCPNCQVWLASQ